jgi:hypothetical protein
VKSLKATPVAWLFIPIGLLVAWSVNGQPMGLTALVVIVFGFICTFLGSFATLLHTKSRHAMETEALANLRSQYNHALQIQLVNMRKALISLSARALRNAAGKMVSEFLHNFDNEEQFDAAVARATSIVDAELNEIADLVGMKGEDSDEPQVAETQEDMKKS